MHSSKRVVSDSSGVIIVGCGHTIWRIVGNAGLYCWLFLLAIFQNCQSIRLDFGNHWEEKA